MVRKRQTSVSAFAFFITSICFITSLLQAGPPRRNRQKPQVVASPFGATSYAMPNCGLLIHPPQTLPSNGIVDYVIRVNIPESYNPNNPDRSVYIKNVASGTSTESDYDNGGIENFGVIMPTNSLKGPFDIDFSASLPAGITAPPQGTVTYVEVRVILSDKDDYQFFSGADPAVGFSDPTNNLGFCGPSSADTSGGLQVRVFYIPMNSQPKGNTNSGSYNIGLIPNDSPTTPIFIDPKVINNGVTLSGPPK